MHGRPAIPLTASGGAPPRQRCCPYRPDPHRLVGVSSADAGSTVPLLAIVLLGLVMSVGIIGATTRHYVRSSRAQWAADAAALAVAAVGPAGGGIEAGRSVAEANGGRLVSVSLGGPGPPRQANRAISQVERNSQAGRPIGAASVVVVVVDYHGVRADAAAQRVTMQRP